MRPYDPFFRIFRVLSNTYVIHSTVSEVKEAFVLDEVTFKAKYGFSKPPKVVVGDKLVVTCRSGRRVKLAIAELDHLGYTNLT